MPTDTQGPYRARFAEAALAGLLILFLVGCSQMPTSGPTANEVRQAASSAAAMVQVVDIDDGVARQLKGRKKGKLFSETFGAGLSPISPIGSGDSVEIHIWEAPPATLFASGAGDPRSPGAARPTTLPEQSVDREGFIAVPFAGRIRAAGLTPQDVEAEVVRRLRGKANQPEVFLKVTKNASSTVTVVGEVASSIRMPISSGGERLLDALAVAGGVRQPVSKMTLQVTRGTQFHALPLDLVIRDPRQNIPLWPGDVVTAIFQPLSFTALGATGRNEEISFEAQGISLAQALGRVGGLIDNRSDAQGLFIFRLESADALNWPRQPVATTPDGLVPVVYRIDMRDPSSFFVMQSFEMQNKDVLFVSNAPLADLQKFLNLVFSVAFPVLNAVQVIQN